MKKRVVICGGSGFIGNALEKRLNEAGYQISIVSRKPKSGQYGWEKLAEVLEGSHAVINLSGRPIACKFTEENKREILESRVNSTRQVSEALQKCLNGPSKWINASAVGFYGDRGDELLTEKSAPGNDFVADVCQKWEDACLKSPVQLDKTVLRFGVVFEANGGALAPLIKVTKLFLGGHAGSGEQWMAWITLHDLTRLIQHAVEHETPPILNACTPNPVKNRELMDWLRGQLKRPWSPPIPAFILKLMGKTVGPDASLLLSSTKVIPLESLDFEFRFPSLSALNLTDIETS